MITFINKLKHRSIFLHKNSYFICFLACFFITYLSIPSITQAHAYSASYTTININSEETDFQFSIDTLSIIEQIDGIDKNEDNELDKSEIKEENHELEEFVHHHLTLDLNNRQQEPTLKKMVLEKKEDKSFLT